MTVKTLDSDFTVPWISFWQVIWLWVVTTEMKTSERLPTLLTIFPLIQNNYIKVEGNWATDYNEFLQPTLLRLNVRIIIVLHKSYLKKCLFRWAGFIKLTAKNVITHIHCLWIWNIYCNQTTSWMIYHEKVIISMYF